MTRFFKPLKIVKVGKKIYSDKKTLKF